MAYKIRDSPAKSGMADETDLLSGKDRFFFFVEQNRAAILGSLALIIVVAVALGALIWIEKQKSGEALILEGKAQALYIDRPLDQPEKTQENLVKASELYRQILDQYPRTTSARHSLYLLGNTLMEQGDATGAVEAYQQFVDEYRGDDMLLGLVYQRLGYAQLVNDNQEAAYQAFSHAISLPNALNKDQVIFEFAKLQESDGNTEKALSYYKQLVESYPESPYANEASLRVKVLAPEENEPEAKEEKSEEAESLNSEDKNSELKEEEKKE